MAIAFIWIYHGLVPKLIFQHETELEQLAVVPEFLDKMVVLILAGIFEITLGLSLLCFWRHTWPVYISLISFSLLLVGALVFSPAQAACAFNPVTLTVSAIVFCLIQLREQNLKNS